jgi:hypothetical protein
MPVGSGSPVKGATGTFFNVVVDVGVVVDVDDDVVVVVVVVLASAVELNARMAHALSTVRAAGVRRIGSNLLGGG